MKIGVLAQGSNGDIEILIPLALELLKNDHEVELLIITMNNRDYSFLQKYANLKVFQIPIHSEFINQEEDVEFWNPTEDKKDTILDKVYKKIAKNLVDYSYRFCTKSDLLIGVHHVFELSCIAEKFNIPYVSVNYPLEYIRTKYEPPLKFSHIKELDNEKLWDLWDNYCNKSKRIINKFRKENGLGPIKNVREELLISRFLNIIPYSKYLCNRKPDWDNSFQISGFIKPSSVDYNVWEIHENLAGFIEGEEKPIFVTTGSMEIHENNLGKFQNILLHAAHLAPRKVIILSNWESGNCVEGNVYKLKGFVSYPAILRKCCLVVHHGGIGILHNATEAGCPSIVIAYGYDQHYNAKLLYDNGISNGSIDRKELNAEKLATLIKEALENQAMKNKAEELALLLHNEDGVKTAVSLIEKYASAYQESKTHGAENTTESCMEIKVSTKEKL